MSELLQAIYAKPLRICCSFESILNLNFGFHNFGTRGAPMVVGISGVGKGVSVLLYRPSTQTRKIFVANCRNFEVKFCSPIWGNMAPMGVGFRGVRWGVSDFLLITLRSP